MALAIALMVTVITLISVILLWQHVWWFPVDISLHGPAMDHQFDVTFIAVGIIFVLAQLGLAYFVWRYRERTEVRQAIYSHGNNTLEITWTLATAVLFIGLGIMAQHIWAEMHFTGAATGSLQIEVTGQQFAWNFRYPGADGQFGPIHVTKIDDAAGNPLGLDPEHDPASRDDIVAPVMAVPLNRSVELILRSKDVTHAFFVRELRLKQDLVPGMEIRVHFTATQTGKYEIVCAELCGLGHHKMRSFLEVMSEDDYKKWLKGFAPSSQ